MLLLLFTRMPGNVTPIGGGRVVPASCELGELGKKIRSGYTVR